MVVNNHEKTCLMVLRRLYVRKRFGLKWPVPKKQIKHWLDGLPQVERNAFDKAWPTYIRSGWVWEWTTHGDKVACLNPKCAKEIEKAIKQ